MTISAVRSLSVYVSDQEKAVDFYTNTLGFALRARMPLGPQGECIEVVPPGGNTAIVLYPRAMAPDWATRRGDIVLRCSDTVMAHQELVRKGVRFTQEPVQTPWGHVFAQFQDPDGNGLGLSNQPF